MITFIARLPRFPRKVAGAALGAVVAGLVLSNSQAHALIVNVDGLDYEVTTFTGSYNDNISKFETAANGGLMPWWGSLTNALAFATAVGPDLGLPNSPYGPYFGYSLRWAFPGVTGSGRLVESVAYCDPPTCADTPNPGFHTTSWLEGSSVVWAQATLVSAAGSANVPGPLPAVGLAVAFGFSRQLRKRIKLHKDSIAVSTLPGSSAEA